MDGSNKDLSSVLSHVETLQKQLVARETELKESRQREEEARKQAEQLSSINSKLSEAKREEMQQDFNSKVREWIKDLDSKQVPEPLKEEFLNSCEKFANAGNDTGVWKVRTFHFFIMSAAYVTFVCKQVVCCASAVHQNQINMIQKLTEDYNALKKTIDGGEFKAEESRKRKEAEPTTVSAFGVWEQLEGMCKSY